MPAARCRAAQTFERTPTMTHTPVIVCELCACADFTERIDGDARLASVILPLLCLAVWLARMVDVTCLAVALLGVQNETLAQIHDIAVAPVRNAESLDALFF